MRDGVVGVFGGDAFCVEPPPPLLSCPFPAFLSFSAFPSFSSFSFFSFSLSVSGFSLTPKARQNKCLMPTPAALSNAVPPALTPDVSFVFASSDCQKSSLVLKDSEGMSTLACDFDASETDWRALIFAFTSVTADGELVFGCGCAMRTKSKLPVEKRGEAKAVEMNRDCQHGRDTAQAEGRQGNRYFRME